MWGRTGGRCWKSVCWRWRGRRPRRPAVRISYTVAWRQGLKGESTRCGFCCNIIPRRRTGGSSSSTRIIRSTRRTAHTCCGQCRMGVPVVHGSHSTITATGPHWWLGREMGRVTSFTLRTEWPMDIHWWWWRMGWESSPSSDNCGSPTPSSPSPGMQITLGRAAPSGESVVILTTWWYEVPCVATYRSQPRESWSCLPITYHGRRPSPGNTGSILLQGAATSGDLWGQRRRRIADLGIKWKADRTHWQPWMGWHVGTRIPHTQAYRSPSSRSGPSCNTSPHT